MQTLGGTLAKIFSRLRYHVFTHQDYMSRIRGGHNYYQIRLSEKPVTASRSTVDILITLDRQTLDIHENDVAENGLILYDPDIVPVNRESEIYQPVPFTQLALAEGGDKIMANTVAIGAVLGLFRFDYIQAEQVIRQSLAEKHSIINGNKHALHAGYNFIQAQPGHQDLFCISMPRHEDLMLINATQAIATGAISAGCKFYAAYPMTPATGIMVYLAGKGQKYNIIVEQAEDEISAINMALGASYAGVRSMTGTSGGGFALMTEGVSLAGITETPIVICEVQRPGPATGLPTRTEQSDLLFVIHGGHGEFAKVVLTPGTPEQAFLAANKAFDLAEKYQIPVFIQSDQYLADAQWTYKEFSTKNLCPNHDYRLHGNKLAGLKKYRRYAFSPDGISPLAVPGDSKHLVVVDSDEHDEAGHITENSRLRIKMVEKRLFRKLRQLKNEISPPELYGSKKPDIILLAYGSTYGIVKESVDILAEEYAIAMLHFSEVYPFPLSDDFNFLSLLHNARQTICIELNATGQFARLLKTETAFTCSNQINSYDGRPFTTDTLLTKIKATLNPVNNK